MPADNSVFRRLRLLSEPAGDPPFAEVQTAESKLRLFVAINRTAKFAVAQLVDTADRRTAWEFLQQMLEAVPY